MGYFRHKPDRARSRATSHAARRRQGRALAWEPEAGALSPGQGPAPGSFRRYAVKGIDEDSQHHRGIFVAAGELQRSGELWRDEYERLSRALTWFNTNLVVPKGIPRRAIFWFKPASEDCHRRTYEIVRLLRVSSYTVWMLQARRPGRMVYEDDLQVAVLPFGARGWERGEPDWPWSAASASTVPADADS